ncbi:MAG: helix-turn-helix transcriptional regulator [Ruminococcaceae bacterium]|nr:helix-turn-helix transcriptional regulator [Oscillospiraceae bacterium]
MIYEGTIVEDGFTITKLYTAFERIFPEDYAFKGEYHNFYELVVVADGELGVAAGSDVLTLKKGQAILHEPMEYHNVWSEGKTTPHVFIFSFQAENMPPYYTKIFQIEDVQAVYRVLQVICAEFELEDDFKIAKKRAEHDVNWQISVKSLETFLLRMLSEEVIRKNSNMQSAMARNYAKALNVLENNINKMLSVEEIARLCNMSEISLQKTFAKYAGIGVIHYYNQLKISVATEMLVSGYSVKECAKMLGFANQNYFSTVFKRITGRSPSEYKRMQKG